MADALDAELLHLKSRFVDASSLCSRSEHICLCRYVVRFRYPLDFVEEAKVAVSTCRQHIHLELNALRCRVHQVELARVLQDLGYARILPYTTYCRAYLWI